jgi:hypothetical protein
MKSHDFIFAVAIGLFGSVVLKVRTISIQIPRAQIEPAKKSAEKMGVKMPDIDKMMAEDTEEDENKTAATKPEPLAALPVCGSKQWVDNEGREQGTLRGTGSRRSLHRFQKIGHRSENEIGVDPTQVGNRRSEI